MQQTRRTVVTRKRKTGAPTVLDLFAGCGGLSTGLQQAGFSVRWANELDADAAQTYAASHPGVSVWQEDASRFLHRVVSGDKGTPQPGSVDLLTGGPPCQGFSGYNRFRSPDDPRNSLVETFLALVEFLTPPYVLMENVPGMLQMEHGRVPRMIIETLKDLGYEAHLGILQAGYYGLPQNRWRVFVLATRWSDSLPAFPEPTHEFPRTTVFGATQFRDCIVKPASEGRTLFGQLLPAVTVADAIGDLPPIPNGGGADEMDYAGPAGCPFQSYVRTGAVTLFDHRTDKQGALMLERIQHIPRRPGAGWLDLPTRLRPKNLLRHGDNRYPNRFGRLWWEGTFNTIVSEAHPYWGRVIHPEQDRVISIRESARAQGLPDRMRIYGTPRSRYRQIGNAVPPPLGYAIGCEILRSMGARVE